ncbi:MAG: carboxypeptidase regulatory-like domain-containing protein [bacterium]|nr:carboxypeptidase regulatory-like domain-containing protein [bacterium]
MTRLPRADRIVLPALAALLVIGSGCAEFGDPWSGIPAGRIEGRVTTGASPVEALVFFDRVSGGAEDRFECTLVVDDDGGFGLDVPAGEYLVSAWAEGAGETVHHAAPHPVYEAADADTITVSAANSPVVIDFALGSLEVGLTLPPGLEGYEGSLYYMVPAVGEDGPAPFQVASRWVEVENGRIDARPVILLPGDYLILLGIGAPLDRSYGYACERVWLPGTRDPGAAARFTVAAGVAAHPLVPVTVEPLRVEGRVGGAWLELGLTSNPSLTVADLDSTELIDSFGVDEDGTFRFDLLLPAEFKLGIGHNYADRTWYGGPRFEQAEVFAIGPGESLSGLEILQCGLRLVLAEMPAGYNDAWCDIYDATGTERLGRHSVYFQLDSQIGIPNLSPGSYLLRIGYDGYSVGRLSWLPQWFDRAESPAGARPILLTEPGEIVTLDLVLENGGTIAGSLETLSTEYHIVFVCREDQPLEWAHTTVSNGAYTFLGLPDGRYKVGAVPSEDYWDAEGFPPPGTTWYPSTPDWDAAGVVEIVGAGTVTGVDIVVPGA